MLPKTNTFSDILSALCFELKINIHKDQGQQHFCDPNISKINSKKSMITFLKPLIIYSPVNSVCLSLCRILDIWFVEKILNS